MKKIILLLIIINTFSCKKQISQSQNNDSIKYDSLVKIGSNLFQKKDYVRAIPNFKKAIELDKVNPLARYRLGVTFAALGDQNIQFADKAISALEIVYSYDSDYERINYNLGICYMIKSDYNNALNYFNKALIKDSLDSDIFYNRALTKLNLKDTISACEDFRKSKKLGDIDAPILMKTYCD